MESVDEDVMVTKGKGASPSMSFRSKVLRSNLTRDHKNRDPLFYYEVQKVLGVGSMGSVVKVRKRDEVVGGSARKNLQETFKRERFLQDCGRIPICGWIAKHCFWNPLGNHEQNLNSSATNSIRNLLSLRDSPFKPISESGHSIDSLDNPNASPSKKYDMTYAMKSIHLSRVTDAAFVEELRNEVSVLKALDHPHIVRCIETFEHRYAKSKENRVLNQFEIAPLICASKYPALQESDFYYYGGKLSRSRFCNDVDGMLISTRLATSVLLWRRYVDRGYALLFGLFILRGCLKYLKTCMHGESSCRHTHTHTHKNSRLGVS